MFNVLDVIESGLVTRYHTNYTVRTQNLAEHCYNVALLCMYLSTEEPPLQLLFAALTHDAAEAETGDTPSPFKRCLKIDTRADLEEKEQYIMEEFGLLPAKEMLTDKQYRVLKAADMLEAMLFCCREAELGNRKTVAPIFKNFCKYYSAMQFTELPAANELMNKLVLRFGGMTL